MSAKKHYFGIDFGTSNSSMAWYDPDKGLADVIPNEDGEDKTPSLAYYGEDGEVLVGKIVQSMLEDSRNYDEEERRDITQRVQRSIKLNLINPPVIGLPGGKAVRPVEVVADILKKLKRDAEEGHFHEEIEQVVITCPAMFGPKQRKVIKEAGLLAGFEEVELVGEPVAAAVAFAHLGQKVGKGVLVYDLGGGTFDVAVVTREEEGSEDGSFGVAMEPDGDDHCGGDNFDQAIYGHCDRIARETLGRSVDAAEGAVNPYLLNECRKQKEMLSRRPKATVRDYLEDGGLLKAEIDLETFENLIAGRVKETVSKTASMRERAKRKGHEVDTVVLIGGSTQVPLVAKRLEEVLGVAPQRFANKDYAVALGAAYHAYEIWKPVPKPEPVYREAVKKALADGDISKSSADELNALATSLRLDSRQAAAIERETLGDTVSAIIAEQAEVRQLARKHNIDISRISGTGKAGRVTKQDVEQHIKKLEEERINPEASRKEYRKAVVNSRWPSLTQAKVKRLEEERARLRLDRREADRIEREVLGGTAKAILAEQKEVQKLAQRHEITLSQVKGTGKGGRITKRDIERHEEEKSSTFVQTKNYRHQDMMIAQAAFSPDGKLLATTGFLETSEAITDKLTNGSDLRVWNLSEERCRTVHFDTSDLWSLAFCKSTGGRLLLALSSYENIAGGYPFAIRLLDAFTLEQLDSRTGHHGFFSGWNIHPVLAADANHAILVFVKGKEHMVGYRKITDDHLGDLNDSATTWAFQAAPSDSKILITSLATVFVDNSRIIASGNSDGTVKIWRSSDDSLFTGRHSGYISQLSFSPNGKLLASAATNDDTVKIWDTRTGQLLHALDGHGEGVLSVSFGPYGKLLATTGGTHNTTGEIYEVLIRLWDVPKGKLLTTSPSKTFSLAATFSPDGRLLANGNDADGDLHVWKTPYKLLTKSSVSF